MSNPFEESDSWEVSTGMTLPEGNFVVEIVSAEDGTTASSGNPKLLLSLEDDRGYSTRDFIAYHGGFLDKVVALFKAAQIPLPQDGEFDPNDECRLTAKCRGRLIGRKVGVVIRNEADQNDPDKMWARPKGYVTVDKIVRTSTELGADTRGLPEVGVAATAGALKDDDIPF